VQHLNYSQKHDSITRYKKQQKQVKYSAKLPIMLIKSYRSNLYCSSAQQKKTHAIVHFKQ